MTARHVVVIGGGLAGITAGIALREAGIGVTVLEARPWLGGATCSFSRGGLLIDNGQHVFLRCCTAYRELLARLGMTGSVAIQDRFDVTVLSGTGPGQARLRRTALPGPLHMTKALARYSFLTPRQRLAVTRAALAMRFTDPAAPGLDDQRLGDWLAARGQGAEARRRLWDLFIVSAMNIGGDDASAALAAIVIKTALLGGRAAADIGVPSVPLGDLHGKAAAGLLRRLGADVRLGAKAALVEPGRAGGFRVRVGQGGAHSDQAAADTGITVNEDPGASQPGSPDDAGAELTADGVVLAVPAAAAARLAPAGATASPPRWAELGTSPIVNVHVIYDRRVTRLPMAAAVDSPVQWVFDKTRQAGLPSGQYLAVSVSAADSYVDAPVASLRDSYLPALEQLFPAARDAQVTDFFVTRERRATFRQGPGSGALRPGAATMTPGLALAGAWTDTGWPDTMEGAVRSGHSAAQELIRQLAAGPARSGVPASSQPAARVSS
ncbi:MAG TPA: hydroxysqualene dehydroxylase HpnE [Streptosporangiaceae bacterium]